MKNLIRLFLVFTCFLGVASLRGQQAFTSCAAAVLNDRMVVDEYTTTGKCIFSSDATGELSVRPVFLTQGKAPAFGEKLPFKVALRDSASGTLFLLSDQTYTTADLKAILSQCKKGDYLVLLTMERQYALPHNEILIN